MNNKIQKLQQKTLIIVPISLQQLNHKFQNPKFNQKTHLADETKTVLVEMPHYEFREKNIQKGNIVGIRPRALRTFEDGAGI